MALLVRKQVCGLMILALLVCCSNSYPNSTVCIENVAGIAIESSTVKACSDNINITNLKNGEQKCFNYSACADGDYIIDIKFETGKMIHKETGYIEYGFISKDSIIVKEDSLDMKSQTLGYRKGVLEKIADIILGIF